MSRTYEELLGATGREARYRPERHNVRDILSKQANPRILVHSKDYPLYDLSANGLSFLCNGETNSWQVDSKLELSLLLHQHEAHRGRGRIARIKPTRTGQRIGVALLDGFLDLKQIQRHDEEARLRVDVHEGPDYLVSLVPEAYRNIVSEAVFFLQFYKESLDHHEARYRAEGVNVNARLLQLAEEAYEAIAPRWLEIRREAAKQASIFLHEPEIHKAAKRYTETAVLPFGLSSPMIDRAYSKPLGYPGDYQCMVYVYNNAFEGDSVFAQVFHKISVEHPLARGIRTRCEFVAELAANEYHRVTQQQDFGSEFRVSSLACGPAREIQHFTDKIGEWPLKPVWTLIDQESEALDLAYTEAKRAVTERHVDFDIQCLELTFTQIFNKPSVLLENVAQDLIYSVGLFDYLPEPTAQALLAGMYAMLRPGGKLAIGNAVGPSPDLWEIEFVLDWTLIYRTREDMERLAKHLPGNAQIEVVKEPSGAYYFLTVTKPNGN